MSWFLEGKNRRDEDLVEDSMATVLRMATGFAVLSVVAAFFVVPMLQGEDDGLTVVSAPPFEIDRTITGSIRRPDTTRRYTIRHSVLQKDPNKPCFIYEDGTREGGC